jgi:hypothetical protein
MLTTLALVLLAAVAAAPSVAAQPAPAAAATATARAEFLRTARVVQAVPIGKGVTRPSRLTLSDGRLTHDAAFQAVDERTTDADRREGRTRAGERDFVDSWRYNVAAYELAVLLGLGDMMPVTVERSYGGRRGALSWWVDDVLMDEEARQQTKATGPNPDALSRQQQTMAVFAALVHDVDRNKGNVLYTKNWRLVMIDFTRAFRLARELVWPIAAIQIRRALFERLEALTADEIRAAAGRWISTFEIDAVLARRDLLLAHFRRLAAARGDAAVFYR